MRKDASTDSMLQAEGARPHYEIVLPGTPISVAVWTITFNWNTGGGRGLPKRPKDPQICALNLRDKNGIITPPEFRHVSEWPAGEKKPDFPDLAPFSYSPVLYSAEDVAAGPGPDIHVTFWGVDKAQGVPYTGPAVVGAFDAPPNPGLLDSPLGWLPPQLVEFTNGNAQATFRAKDAHIQSPSALLALVVANQTWIWMWRTAGNVATSPETGQPLLFEPTRMSAFKQQGFGVDGNYLTYHPDIIVVPGVPKAPWSQKPFHSDNASLPSVELLTALHDSMALENKPQKFLGGGGFGSWHQYVLTRLVGFMNPDPAVPGAADKAGQVSNPFGLTYSGSATDNFGTSPNTTKALPATETVSVSALLGRLLGAGGPSCSCVNVSSILCALATLLGVPAGLLRLRSLSPTGETDLLGNPVVPIGWSNQRWLVELGYSPDWPLGQSEEWWAFSAAAPPIPILKVQLKWFQHRVVTLNETPKNWQTGAGFDENVLVFDATFRYNPNLVFDSAVGGYVPDPESWTDPTLHGFLLGPRTAHQVLALTPIGPQSFAGLANYFFRNPTQQVLTIEDMLELTP